MGKNGSRIQHRRSEKRRERTIYLLVTKLVLEDLYERMPKVPSRCVNRLQGLGYKQEIAVKERPTILPGLSMTMNSLSAS